MIESFLGALAGAVFGVVLGAYLVVKSANKAAKTTGTKVVGVIEFYEN